MTGLEARVEWRSRFPLLATAFLVLTFAYVWLRVEPAIEYQHFGPTFRLSRSFFEPFLQQPGGLAEYAAAYCAQLNYWNWLGAAVFTGLAAVVYWLTRQILPSVGGSRLEIVPLVVPFLLLVLRERYRPAALLLGTELATVLGMSALLARIAVDRAFVRITCCSVMSLLVFYAAGLWALGGFALLVCPNEALSRRSGTGACLSLAPFIIALLWTLISSEPPPRFWNPWSNRLDLIVALAAYGYTPASFLALSLLQTDRTQPPGASRLLSHRNQQVFVSGAIPRRQIPRFWTSLLLFIAAWAGVWPALDSRTKLSAQIAYCSRTGQYAPLLTLAAKVPRDDLAPSAELRLQHALYRTDRLCEDLFSFRNQSTWQVLPGLSYGDEACRPQCQVLLELGLVNDAEHYAHEALELEGERPDILRVLVYVNTLKRRPDAARLYLNVLDQVPFQSSWAKAWLRWWPTEPSGMPGSELAWLRSCMLTNDVPHEGLPTEMLLRQLLYRNPSNRMAFEYLMAHYLMQLQANRIVETLPALQRLGYTRIPRHIEEAILLCEKMQRQPVNLHGLKIRPDTVERFEKFSQALDRKLHLSEGGRRELTRDFGDTFWYYYLARRS